MNKSDFIDYICEILNINTSSSIVYLDISETLDNTQDIVEFRNYIKSRIANLNDDFKYLTGFQKFIKLSEEYSKQKNALPAPVEDALSLFRENLYHKLTLYFDELKWLCPTEEQLKHQIWKTQDFYGKEMINEKESKVCDIIGDTKKIYRLATQEKPKLKDEIKRAVNILVAEKNKADLALANNKRKQISNG